jgi:hypothetical protein
MEVDRKNKARPKAGPSPLTARCSTFEIPLPEDRSAIQHTIGQVLQRIAANDIDPRRAGLLLYGLQIASLNLPKEPASTKPAPQPANQIVEEITTDPELGTLAPPAEVGHAVQRKSPIAQLLESMMQDEKEQAASSGPAILPTLQATEDNSRLHAHSKRKRHPDRSCSRHYREQRSGGTPAFCTCRCLFFPPSRLQPKTHRYLVS